MTTDFTALLTQAHQLLTRLETCLKHWSPAIPSDPDWSAFAYRWRKDSSGIRNGRLEAIQHPAQLRFADLYDIDQQKQRFIANTEQFLRGAYANNILLTGARGTGKSSLIRAALTEYADQGLRVVEVDKEGLNDLPHIVELLSSRPERFILFCDDLSFEDSEPGYAALKSILDGSLAALSKNIIVYATSNRRHLIPEYFAENARSRHIDGEVHPAEAIEEKVSLSERFGLWISFYPFSQEEYLHIVDHWMRSFGMPTRNLAQAHEEALQWALLRGARNGRVAWQFARDYVGRRS